MSNQGHILVVDDLRTNRLKLSLGLKQQGHTVSEAENGRQALDMLRAGSFDLVLLDILMPEMDGFEFLRQLRGKGCNTNVCVVSADIQASSKKLAQELGATEFVNKPFKTEDLLEVINKALDTVKGS